MAVFKPGIGATFAGPVIATGAISAGAATALGWTGLSQMKSPSDGVVTLLNAAGTDFSRIQLGGTSASFPSIRRATTRVLFRLADDSAYCGIETGTIAAAGLVTTLASASGGAGFNLPHGAAPSAPVNGDVWTTTLGLYVRVNGSTVGPLS